MYRLALWLSGSVGSVALSALWLGSGSTSTRFVGGDRPAVALVLRSAFCVLRFAGSSLPLGTAHPRHVVVVRITWRVIIMSRDL